MRKPLYSVAFHNPDGTGAWGIRHNLSKEQTQLYLDIMKEVDHPIQIVRTATIYEGTIADFSGEL